MNMTEVKTYLILRCEMMVRFFQRGNAEQRPVPSSPSKTKLNNLKPDELENLSDVNIAWAHNNKKTL